MKERLIDIVRLEPASVLGKTLARLLADFDYGDPQVRRSMEARWPSGPPNIERAPRSWRFFWDGNAAKTVYCLETSLLILYSAVLAKRIEDAGLLHTGLLDPAADELSIFRRRWRALAEKLSETVFSRNIYSWWWDEDSPISDNDFGNIWAEMRDFVSGLDEGLGH